LYKTWEKTPVTGEATDVRPLRRSPKAFSAGGRSGLAQALALRKRFCPPAFHLGPLVVGNQLHTAFGPLQEQPSATGQTLLDRCTAVLATHLERYVVASPSAIAAWT
jgi:hypothetical protein